MIGFSFSTHFFLLCLWSIPLGLGLGLIDTGLNNVVALHYRAKHMNWLHGFWGVGASIGPIIMSFFLIRAHSWSDGYRAIGLLQFAFVLVMLLTFRLWKKLPETATAEEQKKKPLSKKQLSALPGVKQSMLAFFCYCAIEATVGLWTSSYLVISRGLPTETAALWVALYFIGITAGRFLAGFLTLKLSNKNVIRLGVSLLGLGILVTWMPGAGIHLLIGLFLIGLGCAPIFPILIHETPKNFGAEHSQGIIGMQMAFAYLGSTLMPPVFGFLAGQTSFRIFQFFIGGFLILMIVMLVMLYRIVNNKREKAVFS